MTNISKKSSVTRCLAGMIGSLMISKISEDFNSAIKKIQDFEIDQQRLKKENLELQNKLSVLLDKYNYETQYRKQLDEVKLNMLSVRH